MTTAQAQLLGGVARKLNTHVDMKIYSYNE